MQSKYLQLIAHALILVAIMLGLIAAALWLRFDRADPYGQVQAQTLPPARFMATQSDNTGGGIPDTARQRQTQIEQLDAINKHLADLERGFRDGAFVVQTIDAKEGSKPARPAKESQE
jgi:hypothetical protein